MAFLPLSGGWMPIDHWRMALFVVIFFALLVAAAALGLTADSRDGADWRPTVDGFRCRPR